MTRDVTLHVSFPKFGNNYYSQNVVNRKSQNRLIKDERFDAFMLPSAENHFSNEVIGFNDQFRFLTDVLAMHLLEVEDLRPGRKIRSSALSRSL